MYFYIASVRKISIFSAGILFFFFPPPSSFYQPSCGSPSDCACVYTVHVNAICQQQLDVFHTDQNPGDVVTVEFIQPVTSSGQGFQFVTECFLSQSSVPNYAFPLPCSAVYPSRQIQCDLLRWLPFFWYNRTIFFLPNYRRKCVLVTGQVFYLFHPQVELRSLQRDDTKKESMQ